jgi:hypothetical protein
MVEIINLRRARKEKQRRDKESDSAANRRRFGRTKAQKATDEDAAARRQHTLDGKRLDKEEETER